MTTIALAEVSKLYQKQSILERITLEVEPGEFVAVLGPSGCGKSTLLRLIAGLEHVSSGSIYLNGRCVNDLSPFERDVAMVFQSYALYPHMSVYDNMAYGLRARKCPKPVIAKRIQKTADMLSLSDLLHRKPHELSGGQRQRVAMGRAIVREAALYLFDEPLSNLDSKLRVEMRHEIRRLHKALGSTSLYVTHDHHEAMTMADRIVLLNAGRVEQIGTPQDLYHRPQSLFVAGFIGHYGNNTIRLSRHNESDWSWAGDAEVFGIPQKRLAGVNKTELFWAIRPESLILEEQSTGQDKRIRRAVSVDWVDDLGAERLVGVFDAKTRLGLVVKTDLSPKPGEVLQLCFNAEEDGVFFCAETGQRVGDSCQKNKPLSL